MTVTAKEAVIQLLGEKLNNKLTIVNQYVSSLPKQSGKQSSVCQMSIEIIVNPSEGPSGGNERTVFIKQRTQLRRNKHTCPDEKP